MRTGVPNMQSLTRRYFHLQLSDSKALKIRRQSGIFSILEWS